MIDKTQPHTLAELSEIYQLERPLRKASAAQHRYAISSYTRFLGRAPLVSDLEAPTVNRWLLWITDEKHLARSTANSKRRVVLALWRFAHEAYIVEHLPERIRKIPLRLASPEAWSEAELRTLLAYIDTLPGRLKRARLNRAAYWRAWVLVGFYTGLRLGDLLALEYRQIQPSGWLNLTMQKTGFPIRCFLPPDALQAIEAIRTDRKFVFACIGKTCLQESFRNIIKRAGLVGSTKKLRKSAATAAERLRPGSGSWLLGHRDANIARRYYLDPTQIAEDRPQLPTLAMGGDT